MRRFVASNEFALLVPPYCRTQFSRLNNAPRGDVIAALGVTAAVLAARIQTTAGKLTASASQYVRTDETSAQQLSGLSGGAGRE